MTATITWTTALLMFADATKCSLKEYSKITKDVKMEKVNFVWKINFNMQTVNFLRKKFFKTFQFLGFSGEQCEDVGDKKEKHDSCCGLYPNRKPMTTMKECCDNRIVDYGTCWFPELPTQNWGKITCQIWFCKFEIKDITMNKSFYLLLFLFSVFENLF